MGFVVGLVGICLNFLDLSFVVVGLARIFFFFSNFLDFIFVVRFGFCCYGFG